MSVERLRALVPPPAEPSETGEKARWPEIEAAIGTPLPGDYKEFTHTYGSGAFDGFLFLFSPFAPDGRPGNLLFERDETLTAYTETRRRFPDKLPLPPFPEPGGVLPLGRTDNGDELYWVTEGDPGDWPVLLLESRTARHERHDMGVTAFLAVLLSGDLTTAILPRRFLEREHHEFVPF